MVSKLPTQPSLGAVARRYEDAETVYSVLRSVTRLESSEAPEAVRLVSVLGSLMLDYREAHLPPGVTAVDCEVFLGSVELLAPPHVDVELTGSVVLGSVETTGGGRASHRRRLEERVGGQEAEEDERPLLLVNCSGLMGSVEVHLA